MVNFIFGCIAGWIITIVAVILGLVFCRAAAWSDPESPYYRELK